MSLFKRKKEESKVPVCCCGNDGSGKTPADGGSVCCGERVDGVCCVKVLGAGCAPCHALYENACKAVRDAGLDVEVEYVTDMEKIMPYGVMSMPALVVNERVVSAGKVLKPNDIEKLIK